MLFDTRCTDPAGIATIDEVPVDIVVDRQLSRLAAATGGCAHAVAGAAGRATSQEWAGGNSKERRILWKLKLGWTNTDWHARQLCRLQASSRSLERPNGRPRTSAA